MYGIKEGIINSIFQSISSLTGTGFSTVSFINWNSFGLLILTLLMIFGGMMDSTSSGLKLYRIYIAFELVLNQIKSFSNLVEQLFIWKFTREFPVKDRC